MGKDIAAELAIANEKVRAQQLEIARLTKERDEALDILQAEFDSEGRPWPAAEDLLRKVGRL